MRKLLWFIGVVALGCSKDSEVVTVPGECADGATTSDGTVADDSMSSTETSAGSDTMVAADTTVAPDTLVAADTGPATDTGTPLTDSGTPPTDASGSCAIKTGGDICTTIPKFTGTQVVDGIGNEFCDIPATKHELKKGKIPGGTTLPPPVSDTLYARVAWDAAGIHAHFHVDDPVVVRWPDNPGPDYFEFFIGGDAPTYGKYDGKLYDDGFFDLQISPPSDLNPGLKNFTGGMAPTGIMYLWNPVAGSSRSTFMFPIMAPAKWTSRLVAGGYEAEVFLPWSTLGRSAAPSSGATIAVDLNLSTCDDPAVWSKGYGDPTCASSLYGYSYYAINPSSGPDSCSGFPLSPFCDDRTWCKPKLE